jgi:hypothetical protein
VNIEKLAKKYYTKQGCAHVDGPLCDFPKCSMRRDYRDRA